MSIINCRLRAGYSQRDLADLIGVSPITINHWEVGTHKPRFFLLEEAADALHVSVEDLEADEDPLSVDRGFILRLIDDYGEREFLRESPYYRQNIAKWKNGTTPSMRSVRKLSDFFGLPIYVFLSQGKKG